MSEPIHHFCQYCSRRCVYYTHYNFRLSKHAWRCQPCFAFYYIFDDASLIIQLNTFLNKKQYRMEFYPKENAAWLDYILSDGSAETIKYFDAMPKNVTPTNIKFKIKTYLTFI